MNLWRTGAINSWQLLLMIINAVECTLMPKNLKTTF